MIRELDRANKNLMVQNIPKLSLEKKFTRRELHSLYILYKALTHISAIKSKNFSIHTNLVLLIFKKNCKKLSKTKE